MEAVLESHETAYQDKIKEYLMILNTAQSNLLEVQEQKRVSLVERDLELAQKLQLQENQLHKQLEGLLQRRKQLLVHLRKNGLSGKSLRDVCRIQGWDDDPIMSSLLQEARRLAEALRQTSWGTWVFSHRASQFYGSVLKLIAQGGKKSAVYHDGSTINQEPTGGSLLDASI